jgi:hypothetical protein
MGIQVEFNPDLALRSHDKFLNGEKKSEECVPQKIEAGKVYDFLKNGQRNYFLSGELPLLITEGNGILSRPIASIIIMEATHFESSGVIYTKGKYLVKEVFDLDSAKINFEGFNKL